MKEVETHEKSISSKSSEKPVNIKLVRKEIKVNKILPKWLFYYNFITFQTTGSRCIFLFGANYTAHAGLSALCIFLLCFSSFHLKFLHFIAKYCFLLLFNYFLYYLRLNKTQNAEKVRQSTVLWLSLDLLFEFLHPELHFLLFILKFVAPFMNFMTYFESH